MDTSELVLPGVSLESVVEKASELERVLRSCRDAAVNETNLALEGRDHLQDDSFEVSHRPPPSPQEQPRARGGGRDDDAGLTAQWHKLSSYIVGLEKEVQYYKQLAEEGQRLTEAAQTKRGARSAEQEAEPESTAEKLKINDVVARRENGRSESSSEERGPLQLVSPPEGGSREKMTAFTADDNFWQKLTQGDGECRSLLCVFSYLSTAELCRVARVCRKWYTMSKHPELWRSVSISETVLTSQTLATLSQWCSKTERLSLHGLMPEMASCDEELQTYITRIKGSLELGLVAILSVCGRTLSSILINECNLMITERIFWLLGIYCPSLKAVSYCSDEFPPSSEALWSLAQGSQDLKHLNLPPVLGSPNAVVFNDSCLFQVAQSWPHLLSLTVGGSEMTAAGLAKVAESCLFLSHLELIHGPDFDKDTVEQLCGNGGLPSLRVLILNFTAASRAALELLIEHCPKLERLDLHITLQLYFPESTDSQPDTFTKYEQIVANLRKLEKHPKGKGIFQFYEHYSGIKTNTK